MTLILLLAALAIGADALLYSGAYTQAAYHEIAARVEGVASDRPNAGKPSEAEGEQPAAGNEDARQQPGAED